MMVGILMWIAMVRMLAIMAITNVKLILEDYISDLVTLEFSHLFPLAFEGMMLRSVDDDWFVYLRMN